MAYRIGHALHQRPGSFLPAGWNKSRPRGGAVSAHRIRPSEVETECGCASGIRHRWALDADRRCIDDGKLMCQG